jgi:transcriptional regulator with XRE-family HTH domain
MNKEIGKRLRVIRTFNGLSRRDMSALLKKSGNIQICEIEQGKSHLNEDDLAILADKLNVDIQFLITGKISLVKCGECSYRLGIRALVKALYDAEAGSDCQPSH